MLIRPGRIGSIGRTRARSTGGGGAAEALIPWTPAMIGASEVLEAADPATFRNAAGSAAAAGEAVQTWNDGSSAARNWTAPDSASRPVVGSAGDASPTGVVPLLFRGAASLRSPAVSGAAFTYELFVVARLKSLAAVTETRWVIGASGANTAAYALLQQSASGLGQLRSYVATQVLETSTAERLRVISLQRASGTPLTLTGNINGLADVVSTTSSTTDAFSLADGQSLSVGNRHTSYTTTSGALIDLFAVAVVKTGLSASNRQRMQGYLAHRAGFQSALADSHPYKSAPPMVPEGTTSTLDWYDIDTSTAAQTFMGGYIEIQPDSFSGGSTTPATDGSTALWGFPYSLTPSEQNRLRDTIFPGDGTGLRFVRFPMGFAYRGARNIDGTSGLARNVGERFTGQNAALANMISNVVAGGGGLAPEYWSPAPHWKTTSTFGNGTLWAGAAYSRATTLDSIRVSDPTQYAAQIAAFTDAVIDDMEYVQANVGPIRMFGLQNEPTLAIAQNYGTCGYTGQLLIDVHKVLIPKIRGSSALSTYGGQPNDILLHYQSWTGFLTDAGGVGSAIVSDATVLSTGKTAFQELWAASYHRIEDISADADYLRTNAATWKATAPAKAHFINEFEYFTPGDHTPEWRFANTVLQMVHALSELNAPVVMPIIHVSKQVGQDSSSSNTDGYALTRVRLPSPFSQDPSTPGDPDPTLAFQHFDFVDENWNAAQAVLANVPVGSVRRPISKPTTAGVNGVTFTRPDGKLSILLVNRTASDATLRFDLKASRTLSGKRYRHDDPGSNLAVATGRFRTFVVPAYSSEAWVED